MRIKLQGDSGGGSQMPAFHDCKLLLVLNIVAVEGYIYIYIMY